MPNFWDLVKLTGEFIAGNLKGPTPGGAMTRQQLEQLLTIEGPDSPYFGAEVHVTCKDRTWRGVMLLLITNWNRFDEGVLQGPDGVYGPDGEPWRSPTDEEQLIPSVFELLPIAMMVTDDVPAFTVDEAGVIVLPELDSRAADIHGPIVLNLRILPKGHPERIGLYTDGCL